MLRMKLGASLLCNARGPYARTHAARTGPGPLLTTQNNPEPNGRRVPELCLAANWTQRYSQEGGSGDGWGYMDAGCSSKFIFMCRIMRAQRCCCC
jgi:hypothetical protein